MARRSKVRTTVPSEGVELAIGQGELEGAEPVTFGQFFQKAVQEFPDVAALKWQEEVGEGEESKLVWKTATYAEYYNFCIDAAKSLLKVSKINFSSLKCALLFKPLKIVTKDWSGGKQWSGHHWLQCS